MTFNFLLLNSFWINYFAIFLLTLSKNQQHQFMITLSINRVNKILINNITMQICIFFKVGLKYLGKISLFILFGNLIWIWLNQKYFLACCLKSDWDYNQAEIKHLPTQNVMQIGKYFSKRLNVESSHWKYLLGNWMMGR